MGGAPSAPIERKGEVRDASGALRSCLFCTIAAGASPPNVLWYTDETVSVFVPRSPSAALHLLVVPRAHVGPVSTLDASHAALLHHMRAVGAAQLARYDAAVGAGRLTLTGRMPPPPRDAELGDAGAAVEAGVDGALERVPPLPPRCQLAFHVPPFNSVAHLHLHALRPPFTSLSDRISFAEGWPWCASAESVARRIDGA